MSGDNAIVRRLTPVECERLQGMPDDWSKYGIDENGKVYELSDSARYKLQGNGIATPYVMCGKMMIVIFALTVVRRWKERANEHTRRPAPEQP